jgi:hypothetical protein
MKKITTTALLVTLVLSGFAQSEEDSSEEKTGGFKKEYLFSGGSINLSFFSGVTVLGASPQLGYSVAKWLDAGVLFVTLIAANGILIITINTGNRLLARVLLSGFFLLIFYMHQLSLSIILFYKHTSPVQEDLVPVTK